MKRISTYADYIEAKFNGKYHRDSWLAGFLRNGHSDYPTKILPLPVHVSILDSEERVLRSRQFSVTINDPVYPHLVNVLEEQCDTCQTRLILIQYRIFESINPACIDLIGTHCGLHPDSLSVPFECGFDRTGRYIAHYPSHSLPSERRFLQMNTDEGTFMTATWKILQDKCTCEIDSCEICVDWANHWVSSSCRPRARSLPWLRRPIIYSA